MLVLAPTPRRAGLLPLEANTRGQQLPDVALLHFAASRLADRFGDCLLVCAIFRPNAAVMSVYE